MGRANGRVAIIMEPEVKATHAGTTLAILAGGRSTRLGTDKGLYEPLGDESLVQRSIRLFRGLADEFLICVRDESQAKVYRERLALISDQIRIVTDSAKEDLPNAALTGVATALKHASHQTVVVVPVDQVGVRSLHLQQLLQARGESSAFIDETGSFIPFPMKLAKRHFDRVEALLMAGACSVQACLAELSAERVDGAWYFHELLVNGNTKEQLAEYFGEPLLDPFKRRLHYLRFSLTEACNLSCSYCLPDGFPEWHRHKARLNRDQIASVLGGFRKLGFRKVRFTGGEPTVHPGALGAVSEARRLGYETIALTTNGLLIKDLPAWQRAGLTSLNISLDSVDADEFHRITKSAGVRQVMDLVEEAAKLGLRTKINAVLLRSVNGHRESVRRLADWATGFPVTLRFIELMETKLNGSFSDRERVLGHEVEEWLSDYRLSRSTQSSGPRLAGPAVDYRAGDRPGRIGFINPLSCNFCSDCNRLRITARGELRLCLFGEHGLPLELNNPAAVALQVRSVIDKKPERHHLEDHDVGNVATFRTIGG